MNMNSPNGRERTVVRGGTLLSAVLNWDLGEAVVPLPEGSTSWLKAFTDTALAPASPASRADERKNGRYDPKRH